MHTLRTLLLALVIPSSAFALICETLGPAIPTFNYIGGDKISVKARAPQPDYGCSAWGLVASDVCTSLAKITSSEIVAVTATRAAGTAVAIRSNDDECTRTSISDVFTGGGGVKLPREPYAVGDVDTSGTAPSVARCASAIDDMSTASAAFAAMPPVQTFGRVHVEQDQELVIEAFGGGVINMDELKLAGVPLRPSYGYRGTCAYNYYELGGLATLRIDANPEDEVVINTRSLDIGACAEIDSSAGNVVINVPGSGRKVRVGTSALVAENGNVDILAPERVVSLRGARTEADTRMGSVWARRLVTLGFVYEFNSGPCP